MSRAIISRNPPLIDEDGYSIDSDDDEERVRDAVAAAAEADPYSSIRLEPLNELATQARELMHKENTALWKVRPLLTRLSGDLTWVTPEMMLGPNDQDLFKHTYSPHTLKRKRLPAGDVEATITPNVTGGSTAQPSVNGENGPSSDEQSTIRKKPATSDDDVSMMDSNGTLQKATDEARGGAQSLNGEQSTQNVPEVQQSAEGAPITTQGDTAVEAESAQTNGDYANWALTKQKGKQPGTEQVHEDDDLVMADGSTVVAAGYNGNRAVSPPAATTGEPFIHPIFLAPKSTHPDRDLGLPEQEAEDIRRLLQMYVQKQEEVCRGTKKLYQGLLQADRLRKTVLEWAKAEAHVGEMSDGEDWYDKEEWRLTEDLKKGQDEEEEDTTQTHQKKTRNRK
ncbi:hypothetical protein SLS53_003776 [Cytospora paraplurivora]|uniref:Transcriptional regulatory protein RXT2 N-terminal domain-containing protein n=1 Tax=Cytospora paraplurivora TaxID=2898453 RepID=A0AAN9UA35_9PEZI